MKCDSIKTNGGHKIKSTRNKNESEDDSNWLKAFTFCCQFFLTSVNGSSIGFEPLFFNSPFVCSLLAWNSIDSMMARRFRRLIAKCKSFAFLWLRCETYEISLSKRWKRINRLSIVDFRDVIKSSLALMNWKMCVHLVRLHIENAFSGSLNCDETDERACARTLSSIASEWRDYNSLAKDVLFSIWRFDSFSFLCAPHTQKIRFQEWNSFLALHRHNTFDHKWWCDCVVVLLFGTATSLHGKRFNEFTRWISALIICDANKNRFGWSEWWIDDDSWSSVAALHALFFITIQP